MVFLSSTIIISPPSSTMVEAICLPNPPVAPVITALRPSRLINSLIGSYVIYFIYILAKDLEVSRKGALLVAFVTTFTPSYILFSTLIMRDIMIWILIVLLVLSWVRLIIQYKHYLMVMFSILIFHLSQEKNLV